MASSSEPSVNQTLFLRTIKHFRIAWLFLMWHMIVWFSWIFLDLWYLLKRQDCRGGRLVFWKPLPVTGHIATANSNYLCEIVWNDCCKPYIRMGPYGNLITNVLESDSGKVKNNSSQFNVSLHLRFICVFILMPLLRPSSPTHNLLCYAYAPLLRTMLCLCLHL